MYLRYLPKVLLGGQVGKVVIKVLHLGGMQEIVMHLLCLSPMDPT